MTNKERTPEEHFDSITYDVWMEQLVECSTENLCSLIQNEKLPYVFLLVDFRLKKTDYKQYCEDFVRLDNHVISCYFCSEHYARSYDLELALMRAAKKRAERVKPPEGLVDRLRADVLKRLKEYESEKPENPEKSKE